MPLPCSRRDCTGVLGEVYVVDRGTCRRLKDNIAAQTSTSIPHGGEGSARDDDSAAPHTDTGSTDESVSDDVDILARESPVGAGVAARSIGQVQKQGPRTSALTRWQDKSLVVHDRATHPPATASQCAYANATPPIV